MKKSSKITAWILYALSIVVLIHGFATHASLFGTFFRCVMLLNVPWIICLIDCKKSETKNKGFWIYFLLSFGLIGIPLWLWKRK